MSYGYEFCKCMFGLVNAIFRFRLIQGEERSHSSNVFDFGAIQTRNIYYLHPCKPTKTTIRVAEIKLGNKMSAKTVREIFCQLKYLTDENPTRINPKPKNIIPLYYILQFK